MIHWETLCIKCYASYTSPQPGVTYKVIFKTLKSTTVQKLNHRMALVKSSMSQPLTSLHVNFFCSIQLQLIHCTNSDLSVTCLVTVSHTLYKGTLQMKSVLKYLECTILNLSAA